MYYAECSREAMQMLQVFFPYVLFEMTYKEKKIEISTDDDICEKSFRKIVLGRYRLQHLHLPGTDAQIIDDLRKANPKKWFGEVRYNGNELFVPFIDDFLE